MSFVTAFIDLGQLQTSLFQYVPIFLENKINAIPHHDANGSVQ